MSIESLPTELWKEIFNHISADELREITLACHSFRDISIPLLFQTLTLRHSFFVLIKGMRMYASAGQNIENEMEKLEFYASQPVARWVNRCILRPYRVVLPAKSSDPNILLDAFLRLLPRFSRLQDLDCRFINFNDRTLSQLASFTNKLNVTLASCELTAGDVTSLPVIRARTLQFQHTLSSREFFNSGTEKWIHLMDRDTLEDLTVSSGLASVAFFGDLTRLPRFPNVRSLSTSLPPRLLENFFIILNCFPSLRQLCINGHGWENHAGWKAAAKELMPCLAPPPLTHYCGPCELLRPDIAKGLRSLNLGVGPSRDAFILGDALRSCETDLGNLTYLKVNVSILLPSLISLIFSLSANLTVIHVRGALNTIFQQQVFLNFPFDKLPPNIEQFILDWPAETYAEAKIKYLLFKDRLKEHRPSLKTICLSDWEHAALFWRREASGKEVTQEFHLQSDSEMGSAELLYEELFPEKAYLDF